MSVIYLLACTFWLLVGCFLIKSAGKSMRLLEFPCNYYTRKAPKSQQLSVFKGLISRHYLHFFVLRDRNPLISQELAVLIFYILLYIKDYSMIVATRFEPTVLPPSRIRLGEPYVANGVFSGFSVILFSKNINFLCVFKIFVAILQPKNFSVIFKWA